MMNLYSIALFLHITGALGFFIVLGLEWIGMSKIRSAGLAGEARGILAVVDGSNRLGFVSMLTTVVTGIYMMLTVWGGAAWLWVVIGSLVLEIVLFRALTAPRMAVIARTLAAENGPVSQAFRDMVSQPVIWLSIHTRAALVLGIVFLKVAKPGLGWSLLSIAAAIALGLASAVVAPRREQAEAGPAD
jgi:hypothetical protein